MKNTFGCRSAIPTFSCPGTKTFTNRTPIFIPDVSPASPYPSIIRVSGLTGRIRKVAVTIHKLTHSFLRDLEILLVGPQGQNVLLMADVGNFGPGVVNATYTFDDAAPGPMLESIIPPPGIYQPSPGDEPHQLPFPAPQEPPPYGTALSVFNGTNPNGTWQLFVNDDAGPDVGVIAGGWSLTITASGCTQ